MGPSAYDIRPVLFYAPGAQAQNAAE